MIIYVKKYLATKGLIIYYKFRECLNTNKKKPQTLPPPSAKTRFTYNIDITKRFPALFPYYWLLIMVIDSLTKVNCVRV